MFGSYGWGDGEWMRNWESVCHEAGANLICDFVIANEAPDDEAVEACKAMGAALAKRLKHLIKFAYKLFRIQIFISCHCQKGCLARRPFCVFEYR